MRSTVFFREPPLLNEMGAGDLFVPHSPGLAECVCARLSTDNETIEAALFDRDEIVVVACRVGEGEVGHRPTGHVESMQLDTWVTPVELIEPPAFRERMPLDEIPAVVPERAEPTPKAAFEVHIRATAPAS